MPWSAKAGRGLIESQYAPVATSATDWLPNQPQRRWPVRWRAVVVLPTLDARLEDRAARAARYATAWAPYVWPVSGIDDLKVAPFSLPVKDGVVWFDHDHVWHMTLADRLGPAGDGVVTRTQWRVVDLADASACAEAIAWWETLIGSGGEGMVVKPRDFVGGDRRMNQPALKVRGPEYLRIIYGPEYDAPENLAGCEIGAWVTSALWPSGVRPGCRGAEAFRPPASRSPGPRMRLRRPGAGERAVDPRL